MTFDPHKPARTRDGRPAKLLRQGGDDSPYPLTFLVPDQDGGGTLQISTTRCGNYIGSRYRSDLDLENYTPEPEPTPMTPKFDPSKPVQTRDGRAARILCTDRKHPVYPIVAVLLDPNGTETVENYTPDGRYSVAFLGHQRDLVNTPEEHTLWIAAVCSPLGSSSAWLCASREEALAHERKGHRLIACIPVTYKEGDGLPPPEPK